MTNINIIKIILILNKIKHCKKEILKIENLIKSNKKYNNYHNASLLRKYKNELKYLNDNLYLIR